METYIVEETNFECRRSRQYCNTLNCITMYREYNLYLGSSQERYPQPSVICSYTLSLNTVMGTTRFVQSFGTHSKLRDLYNKTFHTCMIFIFNKKDTWDIITHIVASRALNSKNTSTRGSYGT